MNNIENLVITDHRLPVVGDFYLCHDSVYKSSIEFTNSLYYIVKPSEGYEFVDNHGSYKAVKKPTAPSVPSITLPKGVASTGYRPPKKGEYFTYDGNIQQAWVDFTSARWHCLATIEGYSFKSKAENNAYYDVVPDITLPEGVVHAGYRLPKKGEIFIYHGFVCDIGRVELLKADEDFTINKYHCVIAQEGYTFIHNDPRMVNDTYKVVKDDPTVRFVINLDAKLSQHNDLVFALSKVPDIQVKYVEVDNSPQRQQ